MREVLKGLEYMHRNNLIHRDIKAGNILLDADTGAVKLADFGVVATLERRGSWGHDLGGRQTMCGTPCWMAPEVLLAEQGASVAYKSAADIWSVGITLFEMAHGHAPFSKARGGHGRNRVTQGVVIGQRRCKAGQDVCRDWQTESSLRRRHPSVSPDPQLAPMHVFMRIIRDEPPNLESGDDGDTKKSFSKGFKDVVAQASEGFEGYTHAHCHLRMSPAHALSPSPCAPASPSPVPAQGPRRAPHRQAAPGAPVLQGSPGRTGGRQGPLRSRRPAVEARAVRGRVRAKGRWIAPRALLRHHSQQCLVHLAGRVV